MIGRGEARPSEASHASIVGQGVAIGAATGAYALSFGALSVQAGLSVWQTCALSLLMFTGASQFAFIAVVGAGGAPLSAATTAVLLSARNGLYGFKLATTLGWAGLRRAGAAQLVIDESTALSLGQRDPAAARVGFLAGGLSVFVLWNLGTLLGALVGQSLEDPGAYGLDAAVGGAFLALMWPHLRSRMSAVVAIAAASLALGLVPFAPAGVPVLAAAFVALFGGVVTARQDAAGAESDDPSPPTSPRAGS